MFSHRRRTAVVLLFVVLATACSRVEQFSPPALTTVTDPTFRLAVVGDLGSGDSAEDAVARGMRAVAEEHGLDALVTTGDNVYPVGHSAFFDAAWLEPYGWVTDAGIDVIASLGNHDIASDGGAAVMELLNMPDRYYSVTVGDADIIVLDGNTPTDPAQRAWLEDALAGSSQEWKIVVFHQPAYSCSMHDSTLAVQQEWVPLLEDADVDLVLNGHDHVYQRFNVPSGPTYVVTGGGGGELYELDECPAGTPTRAVGDDDHHHFLYVQGSGDGLRVNAIASDGTLIDRFTIVN